MGWGAPFTIVTDHAPLNWLHQMKDANPPPTLWYLALQPYSFIIKHQKGQDHAKTDFSPVRWCRNIWTKGPPARGARWGVGGRCHIPISKPSYFPMGLLQSPASITKPTQLSHPWTKPSTTEGWRKDFGLEKQQHWLNVLEMWGGGGLGGTYNGQ